MRDRWMAWSRRIRLEKTRPRIGQWVRVMEPMPGKCICEKSTRFMANELHGRIGGYTLRAIGDFFYLRASMLNITSTVHQAPFHEHPIPHCFRHRRHQQTYPIIPAEKQLGPQSEAPRFLRRTAPHNPFALKIALQTRPTST